MALLRNPSVGDDEPFDRDEAEGPPDLVRCPICEEWHALGLDGYVYADCAYAAVKNAKHDHAAESAA